MKRIALDRFPISAHTDLKKEMQSQGHKIVLSTFTVQSDLRGLNEPNVFIDRDVAIGLHNKDVPWSLNIEEIKNASLYEGLAIKIFSRYDVGQKNFSATDMSTHFYDLLNFWTYQIKKNNVTTCFHYYLPHDPSSFVLYLSCKLNKIEVIYIDVPHIFNNYRYMSCSFGQRNLLLRSKPLRNIFNINKHCKKYKELLDKGNLKSIPLSVRYRYINKRKILNLNKVKRLIYYIKKLRLNSIPKLVQQKKTFFKVSKLKWSSRRSDFLIINYHIRLFILYLQLKVKEYEYISKCKPLPKEDFLYFAMPAQPEGSTLPTALQFNDIFMVLKILRQGIPAHIPIVIKENLSVFKIRNPYISLVSFKSPDFYDRLKELGNIQFINCNFDSHELIRKSILTSSINGTIGIESINLGKQCIIFGPNWYDSAKGIHLVSNTKEVKEAWKEINSIQEDKPFDHRESLDRDMMIKFDKHNPYQFEGNSKNEVVSAFNLALKKFSELDERKWEI